MSKLVRRSGGAAAAPTDASSPIRRVAPTPLALTIAAQRTYRRRSDPGEGWGMPDTSLYEAMSTLRAVRRLRPDPIPDDVMERVLQAAAWAPSGGNQQPWRVVVVTDSELKQGLADLCAPEWARFAIGYEERGADLSADDKAALMRTLDAGNHLAA